MGLPLSLWVPSILRRVGDECGGFVAMDPLTERMENLRWARILVKTKGGELPSSLEIGVEGISYNLPLWWECCRRLDRSRRATGAQQIVPEERSGATEAHALTREWKSGVTQGSRRCHGQLTGRVGF